MVKEREEEAGKEKGKREEKCWSIEIRMCPVDQNTSEELVTYAETAQLCILLNVYSCVMS